MISNRTLPASSRGLVSNLFGEFRLAATGTGLTTIAARTATAGHVFAMRNPDAAKLVLLRYLAVDFLLTTAFGTAQAIGYDAIVGRTYTASHTAGTALDMGSTNGDTGKVRKDQATSLFTANTCRIGGAAALTAGTHTLDANPFGYVQGWAGAVGQVITGETGVLLDAREGTGVSPLELAKDEGVIIRNAILMGATGVGTLVVKAQWDEVVL